MLERLNKLKSSVRYYVAYYKNNHDSLITAEEWQLVNSYKKKYYSTARTFFCNEKSCKNNALLPSVIPHARSLTKFVNFYKNSEVSNLCKTLAKNLGEACERRFYTDNNNLNLNNNKLLLVITAVDLRYRLSAFSSYLKNNVKE